MIFRRVDDGEYVAIDPQFSVEFHIDHLRRDRHELVGELRVVAGFLGNEGVLSHASFNFSSAQTRSQRARLLAEQARTKPGEVPWLALLEETCQLALKAERTGDPGILLRSAAPATPDDTFTIDGFTFPKKHPTIVFGDGSTAKSYHALRDVGELAKRGVKPAMAIGNST